MSKALWESRQDKHMETYIRRHTYGDIHMAHLKYVPISAQVWQCFFGDYPAHNYKSNSVLGRCAPSSSTKGECMVPITQGECMVPITQGELLVSSTQGELLVPSTQGKLLILSTQGELLVPSTQGEL